MAMHRLEGDHATTEGPSPLGMPKRQLGSIDLGPCALALTAALAAIRKILKATLAVGTRRTRTKDEARNMDNSIQTIELQRRTDKSSPIDICRSARTVFSRRKHQQERLSKGEQNR